MCVNCEIKQSILHTKLCILIKASRYFKKYSAEKKIIFNNKITKIIMNAK